MDRKGFIGSSDIAAVLGLSRWCSPLKCWAIKSGKIESDDLTDNQAVEWGTRLEKIIGEKFAEEHGVKIIAYKKRFEHPKHTFLTCELDRIIAGTDIIVEIKTCSAFKAKEWIDDEMPQEYILQVQFAMGISGRKKAFVVCLIGGQRYVEKELDFDPKLFETMVERSIEFMEMVNNDTPPVAMAEDAETLAMLYPGGEVEELEVDDDAKKEIDALMEFRNNNKKLIKETEKLIKFEENRIKEILQNKELLNTDRFRISWKPQTSKRVDTKKLKADELYDKYSYESESKVFRVAEIKKKEK